MAEFAVNKPVTVDKPEVTVDLGLLPGVHVFQLQVEDNLGQVSDAVVVRVSITVPTNPLIIPPIIPPILRPNG
jgi:hypothetical protein